MKTKTAVKKAGPKKATSKKAAPKKAAPKKTTTAKSREPRHKNLDIYGAKPIPWSRALEELSSGSGGAYWLATTKPDGRPHVAAVGALWVDGEIYFTSGAGTRKSRDLAANPNCVLAISLTGIDVVFEGRAVRVLDRSTLQALAERYAAQGWPASVSGAALTAEYSAPSAGPPPWDLYVVRPRTAFGVATADPPGATRWEFEGTR